MRILPGKNGSEPSDNHRNSTQGRLDLHIYPFIGDLPVGEVTIHHMLDILKRIEDKGSTRDRVKGHMEAILFYALAHKYIDQVPAKIPGNVLKAKQQVEHRKALPFEDLPKFLRDLDSWSSNISPNGQPADRPRGHHPITKFAIKFMILTLARPCEVRRAKWEQIDWKERLWKIPAENMKEDRWHVVHLADQTMELLMELKEVSGDCEQLFPGIDDRYNREVLNDSKPISEATMLNAIRQTGYECDAHGFRGTASTYLNSLEDDEERQMWEPKWIEFALSHKDKDQVATAYNAYRYQKPRARMLQFYADQVFPTAN